MMRLELTMKTEASVLKRIQSTAKELALDKRLVVSPPRPAFHERTNKGYTWQIIVRSRSRSTLLEVCDKIDKNFKIVLDPPGLL